MTVISKQKNRVLSIGPDGCKDESGNTVIALVEKSRYVRGGYTRGTWETSVIYLSALEIATLRKFLKKLNGAEVTD